MKANTGARGTRKESQFAGVLVQAAWTVEGPKPRARFGRTDYFGCADLLAVRDGILLIPQCSDATHDAEKRREFDRALPHRVLPNGGSCVPLIASWGHRERTGWAWKVQVRGARGWRAIGFVRLDGVTLEPTPTLTRLFAGVQVHPSPNSQSTPSEAGGHGETKHGRKTSGD